MLITDSLPADGKLGEVMARITTAAKGRPMHTILVQTPEDPEKQSQNSDCEQFARKLAACTGAVLRKIKIDVTGRNFDDVTLVKQSKYDTPWSNRQPAGSRSFPNEEKDGTTFLLADKSEFTQIYEFFTSLWISKCDFFPVEVIFHRGLLNVVLLMFPRGEWQRRRNWSSRKFRLSMRPVF